MQALFTARCGGPEVLEVRELPEPLPDPGEVRIRVHACGLGYADVLARQGRHPEAPPAPCVLGYEGAGEVDALGEGVSAPEPGTRVVFVSRFGAQASSVCVPAAQVAPMPDPMGFEIGAAVPIDYLTAHHALFEVGRLQPGSHVLIHLAASPVGTAALQLCSATSEVSTFGTAPAHRHEHLVAMGCQHAIDPNATDYASEVRRLTSGRGVEVVLDPLGGPDWRIGYGLLRPSGVLVVLGAANLHTGGRWGLLRAAWELVRMPRFSPLRLLRDSRAVAGVDVARLLDEPHRLHRQLDAVMSHASRGVVRPAAGGSYRFSEAAAAHEALETADLIGKPVLVPDEVWPQTQP